MLFYSFNKLCVIKVTVVIKPGEPDRDHYINAKHKNAKLCLEAVPAACAECKYKNSPVITNNLKAEAVFIFFPTLVHNEEILY